MGDLIRKYWLLIVILTQFAGANYTQAQIHQFRNYDIRHGLYNSEVNFINSDSSGFLWLGTSGSVYKFNGQRFKEFGIENGLPNQKVRAIYHTNNLTYVGTENGLAFIDSDSLITVLENEHIRALLNYKGALTAITTSGVFVQRGSEFERVSSTFSEVYNNAIVHEGKIWIGSESDGIILISEENGNWFKEKLSAASSDDIPQRVRGMATDDLGELWVVSLDQGIQIYDGTDFNAVKFQESKNYLFSSIAYDPNEKAFWCGTWGNGLVKVTKETIESFSVNNGLKDKVVKCVFIHNDGHIFGGTMTQGLFSFANNSTILFNHASGLTDDHVRSITKFKDNIILADLSGISVFNGIDLEPLDSALTGKRFGALLNINDDILYLGSYTGLLYEYDGRSIIRKHPVSSEILSLAHINGTVYIGCQGEGLLKLEKHSVVQIDLPSDIKNIWSMFPLGGKLYLGTENGLYLYEPDIKKISKLKSNIGKLDEGRINQIGKEILKDGITIASENSRLALYDTSNRKDWLRISKDHGLERPIIRAFVYEEDILYAASNTEIFKIKFGNNGTSITPLFNITDFGNKEINPGGLFLDGSNLWVATGFGAVRFDLDIRTSKTKGIGLKVILDEVKINGELVRLDSLLNNSNIEFEYTARQFEFAFSNINFNTDNSYYQYRLIGLDEKWTKFSSSNEVSYSNLKPGSYTLQFRVADEYKNVSEIQELKFTVLHPYWQDWQFLSIILLIALISFSIFLFVFKPKSKVKSGKSTVRQTALTSRLILIFGAIAYPLIGYIDTLVDPLIIDQQTDIALLIGALTLTVTGLSFIYKELELLLPRILILIYVIILSHLGLVMYINNLTPTHVIGFILFISVSSVVFNTIRHIIFFGCVLIVMVSWLAITLDEPYLSTTQFISTTFSAYLVSTLIVLVRINIFNKLELRANVLNSIDSLVLVADKNSDIIYASDSVERVLGYKKRDVLGQGWWKISGDQLKIEQQKINVDLHNGVRNSDYVSPIVDKKGEVRYFRWIDTPLLQGQVAGVGYDVTETYLLQTELEKLSIVATKTGTGVVILDEKLNIQWVNEAFSKMVEYSEEELIGKRPADILSGPNTDVEQILATREEVSREEGYHIEALNYTKSGKEIWLDIASNPVKNENGQVFQVVELITDITHKKESENTLRQLSLVASKTDNYVIISDSDDKVVWVNEAFTQIFGFEMEEIKEKKVSEFLSTEVLNPNEIASIRNTVFEEKQNYVGEFCDRTKDNNIIWVSTNITPVLNEENEIDYIISLGTDITNRKLQEFQMNQFAKANEMMHGIDSVLIQQSDVSQIAPDILRLVMTNNADFQMSAFFDIDIANKTTRIDYCERNLTSHVKEEEDWTAYTSYQKISKGEIFINDNILDLDELSESDKWLMFNGVKSYMMVPIKIENEVRGALAVGANRPYYFSENHVETYSNIADSIAVVLLQKENSKLLQESEENFRQLNESISEAFWLSDLKKHRLIYVNSTFEKLFGVQTHELHEDPSKWTKNVHPDDLARVISSFKLNAQLGTFNEDYRVLINDEVRWVNSTAYPISNNKGEVIRLSGSSRDITESKKTEEAILSLNEQLKSINILNQSVLKNEDLSENLYDIVVRVFDQKTVVRLNITLYDFEREKAKYHFLRDNDIRIFDTPEFNLSAFSKESISKLKKGEFVLVDDIKSKVKLSESDQKMLESGINAFMMYPLHHNDNLLGSLNISFGNNYKLDFEKIKFMKMLAEGISISIYQKILQDTIEEDKLKLQNVNNDLSDSINYAKRFQDARLPSLDPLKNAFNNADVYYKPRDIVSGDFYWVAEKGDKLFFAAADCTGHGVPGAFMTLLFNSILDKILTNHVLNQPSDILDGLNDGIIDYFKSNRNAKIQDGMDIALCMLDKSKNEYSYSGARRPLIIYRNESKKIDLIEGNKISIGEDVKDAQFTTTQFTIKKDDSIYLLSDGFIDQFGGPEYRKYGKRRLLTLIEGIGHQSAHKQIKEFDKTFVNWKGDRAQIDDVVIMVVKV